MREKFYESEIKYKFERLYMMDRDVTKFMVLMQREEKHEIFWDPIVVYDFSPS